MNNRDRVRAILHYQQYDRIPIIHFGYWEETLERWHHEGHLTSQEIQDVEDGNEKEHSISERLGFDFNWFNVVRDNSDVLSSIFPPFERTIIETLPDGMMKVQNEYGVVEMARDGARSIPAEVDHLLEDRKSWEELFKSRLQYSRDRFDERALELLAEQKKNAKIPWGFSAGVFLVKSGT